MYTIYEKLSGEEFFFLNFHLNFVVFMAMGHTFMWFHFWSQYIYIYYSCQKQVHTICFFFFLSGELTNANCTSQITFRNWHKCQLQYLINICETSKTAKIKWSETVGCYRRKRLIALGWQFCEISKNHVCFIQTYHLCFSLNTVLNQISSLHIL